VRTAVRQTEFLVRDEVTRRSATGHAAVREALARVTQEANAYVALPMFPGEESFWADLSSSIAAFNGAVERALAQSEAGGGGASPAALAGVMAAADAVSEAANRAIGFNANTGRELALRIKSVRRSAEWMGYVLNAACVVFAIAAAAIVRRQLRRHDALAEEHAALQETRAQELEAFAGRAAHDILNPVAATQMALALAARPDLHEGAVRELVERALNNQKRVRNIVDGLLQFARAGARPSPGDFAEVSDVVEDVTAGVRPAAERAGIELRVEELPRCRAACSVGVLASVVSNLEQNAMKYMGDGEVRRITVRAAERGPFVHLEVEDTGPGIPRDALGEIFLPYVRGPTHGEEGLGLGLATVKRLCEGHGGHVGVRSAVGQGSAFWIELPLARGSSSPAA
jgi:signal transduction histidine kinase